LRVSLKQSTFVALSLHVFYLFKYNQGQGNQCKSPEIRSSLF
jgi:hypothetical protein